MSFETLELLKHIILSSLDCWRIEHFLSTTEANTCSYKIMLSSTLKHF